MVFVIISPAIMPTPSVHFFETNEEERKNKKALAVDEKRRER